MALPDQITLDKGTYIKISLWSATMIIGALATAISWLTILQTQTQANSTAIQKLQTDSVTTKVQWAEVQVKLSSIDANILDVKQRLIGEGK